VVHAFAGVTSFFGRPHVRVYGCLIWHGGTIGITTPCLKKRPTLGLL